MASARTFYRTPLMSYARLDDPGSATGSPRAGMDALTPAQASPPGAEQTVAGAGEGAGASGGATGGTFSLMVLDQKGSKYEIDGLRAGSTVGELRDKLRAIGSRAWEDAFAGVNAEGPDGHVRQGPILKSKSKAGERA